jgi:hypothetical protein
MIVLERSLNGASKEYLANIKKKLNYWWRGNTQEPLHLAYDKPFHKRLLHQAIRDR